MSISKSILIRVRMFFFMLYLAFVSLIDPAFVAHTIKVAGGKIK